MASKKKEETPEKKLVLGRLTSNLKMGIIGLPRVGKSLFFNLLAKKKVQSNKSNTTSKDLVQASLYVPDERLAKLSEIFQPKKTTSTMLTIVDVAGQLTGSYKGEGLGSGFLSHIREVDGIFHIIRAFEDEELDPSESDVNPIRDLEAVAEEMRLKDIEIIDRRIEDLQKQLARTKLKENQDELEILQKIKLVLEKKHWIKDFKWNNDEIEVLNDHHFLTAKPIVYLINMSSKDFLSKKNKWLAKINDWIKKNAEGPIIPFSALHEKQLVDQALYEELNEHQETEEKKLEINEKEEKNENPSKQNGITNGTTNESTNKATNEKYNEEEKKIPIKEKIKMPEEKITMLPKILKTGLKILDLIIYYTVGEDECKAWTIREGWKAPKAASVIHSDIEKGFICADVMKFEDFVKVKSIPQMKDEGKYRQQGKEYTVEDGDIIDFKFNIGKKPNKK